MVDAVPGGAMRVLGPLPWGPRQGIGDWVLRLEFRRAVLWLPVGIGLGIWAYFAWPAEPPVMAILAPLPGLMLLALPIVRRFMLLRVLALVALALGLGFALALGAAVRAEGPRLGAPVTATLEGRVVAVDRAASGAPRVLLERATLFGYGPERTPARMRVALLEQQGEPVPPPGTWLMVRATFFPPSAPVEPGAFDFARHAYFEGIGATGFARNPALMLPAEEAAGARAEHAPGLFTRLRLGLSALRLNLADALRARMPGRAGAFAAAIIVGDRSAIEEVDAEALRISSLAHLLAISGLHMGLLTALVFSGTRAVLALVGPRWLPLNVKKLAAVFALCAAAGYLMLSGGTVATQRAFVMVAVALFAVLIDRPAISLRGLALAAIIVLAIHPVALFNPGFQMSFAATTALVAAYEALTARRRRREAGREEATGDEARATPLFALRLVQPLTSAAGAVLFTSIIAGTATAPFAGVHFNRVATWGLLANLGAVPVMGAWIAPAGIAAGLAAPFGLAQPFLDLMGLGIEWVLSVAHGVAALPGADHAVPAAGDGVLGAIALGGLWAAVWRGPWRVGGVAVAAMAAVLWQADPPPRPALLIAAEGRLVGLMGPEGRVLDRARGQGYAAETWLRRDGDRVSQEKAASRPGFSDGEGGARLGQMPGGWRVAVLKGRGATAERQATYCTEHTLLVAPRAAQKPPGRCRFIGFDSLQARSVAVHVLPHGTLSLVTAKATGCRRWQVGWRRCPSFGGTD
ncbi:MAG: ComEC/Rec2 family competence protein [Pseudomonadota bacterium]